MGYDKIQGELLKPDFTVNASIVKNVLRRQHLLPAPQRGRSSWRTFLKHYCQHLLACDFFTVETVRLEILYVLFFIELGTRRVHFTGCTRSPDRVWGIQQARQFAWDLSDEPQSLRFLMHDRDSKFATNFDQVFLLLCRLKLPLDEGFSTLQVHPFGRVEANSSHTRR